MENSKKVAIQGAKVLTTTGWVEDGTVLIESGKFVNIDHPAPSQSYNPEETKLVNAQGLLMLPGIIDLHGDTYERIVSPRPGITFPLSIALVENDRSLLAAGITTSFCSITDSFEPGVRSRDTGRAVIDFILGEGKQILRCQHFIHIRHEKANTKGHEELCDWLESGKVQLLSINDHLPSPDNEQKMLRYLKGFRRRVSMSEAEMLDFIHQIQEERHSGEPQVEELVAIAHSRNIPLASHDDHTEARVALSRKRRVAIAEFPATVDLAAKSRDYGASVLMGAPNLIRGGSHLGWMSVAEAIENDVVDCLCSDYHYPSLFYAPFQIEYLGLMSFTQAWNLVSSHPAAATGIDNCKGSIAPNLDADFILVSPHPRPFLNSIVSVYIAGKEAVHYS